MNYKNPKHLESKLQVLQQRLNVLDNRIEACTTDPQHLHLERSDVNLELARVEKELEVVEMLPSSLSPEWSLSIGAQADAAGTTFRVWSHEAHRVEVVIFPRDKNDKFAVHELRQENDSGYFSCYIPNVLVSRRYEYRLHRLNDCGWFPDPASRYQPDGVHGPSEVVDPEVFDWTDYDWRGITLEDLVIYEVHVGTATEEGTFDALITRLGDIRKLGVTAIELMPVADFPGERNWGYDGVSLFAPSRAYGGPEGLRRLVDAAHARGLAVILDAVFNHMGPDGNYLAQFSGTYFDPHYKTPWGQGFNFNRRSGRPVRQFFIENACYWAHEYHIDGLRLDAVYAMSDDSEPHILRQITRDVRASLPQNRTFLILAEDDNNESELVEAVDQNGFGLDAIWADDFHHEIHVALMDEREGYYVDYRGVVQDLVKILKEGWLYTGQLSRWRKQKPHGSSAKHLATSRFIYCIQNHDQIGNRPDGKRLNELLTNLDAYRVASALLLLSPYTPLLFMGQEWSASTPFHFFSDHHEELGHEITQGRKQHLSTLFPNSPDEEMVDPQDRNTFLSSKLRWEERTQPQHAGILQLYCDLLHLRRQQPALSDRSRETFEVNQISECAFVLRRQSSSFENPLLVIVNIQGPLSLNLQASPITAPPNDQDFWTVLLDTESFKYGGKGDIQLEGEMLRISGPRVLLLSIRKENSALPFTSEHTSNAVRDQVFISYSHRDQDWLSRLQIHLSPLIRNQGLSVWADTQIQPGTEWREEIERALLRAKVAVLLVSPNFLSSEFILNNELPPLLAVASNQGLKVIWVCLSYCMYNEIQIEKYQAANDPKRPLASLSQVEQDEALVNVCRRIKAAAAPD